MEIQISGQIKHQNMGVMIAQYLSPMLILMSLTLLSIYRPRIGGVLIVIISLYAIWFFRANSIAALLLIILPLAGLGGIVWFGRPQPKKWAEQRRYMG